MKGDLARFSTDDRHYAAFVSRLRKPADAQVVVSFVELDNKTSLPDWVINAHIDLKTDEPLDWENLQANIERIYGIDTFVIVDFRLAE